MTYKLLCRIIAAGGYDAADLMKKTDVYYLFGRLTEEEYREIADKLTHKNDGGM